MELFTENEIWLMIGVVSVLLFSILVLALLDYRDRRKLKKAMNVVVDDSVEFGETMEEVEVEDTPREEMVEVLEVADKKVDNQIEVEEPFMEEEFEPIKKVESTIAKEIPDTLFLEEEKVDLGEEEAMEIAPAMEDAVTNFEMEQERTAIISLDELMQKSEYLYNSNEVTQYDEGNEPISIDEVISRFNAKEEKSVPEIMQDIVEEKVNGMSFENTATYEKLSRENKNDFVAKLREANENK